MTKVYVPGALTWLAVKLCEIAPLVKVPLAIGPPGPVSDHVMNGGQLEVGVLPMQPILPEMVTPPDWQGSEGQRAGSVTLQVSGKEPPPVVVMVRLGGAQWQPLQSGINTQMESPSKQHQLSLLNKLWSRTSKISLSPIFNPDPKMFVVMVVMPLGGSGLMGIGLGKIVTGLPPNCVKITSLAVCGGFDTFWMVIVNW